MHLRYALLVTLIGALASSQPILSVKYLLVTSLYVEGQGVVDREVFSRVFLIAPPIPGWQNLSSATLYVDSRKTGFALERDPQGNIYAYPGDLEYSGSINITLVQEVEVASPPFRRIADLPEVVDVAAPSLSEMATSQFWGCNSSSKKFADVVSLAKSLGSSSASGRDFILNAADWVRRNVKYTSDTRGGVKCPAETLSTLEGACGDVHALFTALLRIKGINSYLAYALVYSPQANLTIREGKWFYQLRGAEPHIFSMVESRGESFPVDLTANTENDPQRLVRGSAVNQLDSLIVLAWIKRGDPNDFLAIPAPVGASKVSLTFKVARESLSLGDNVLLLLAVLLAAALALRKERST